MFAVLLCKQHAKIIKSYRLYHLHPSSPHPHHLTHQNPPNLFQTSWDHYCLCLYFFFDLITRKTQGWWFSEFSSLKGDGHFFVIYNLNLRVSRWDTSNIPTYTSYVNKARAVFLFTLVQYTGKLFFKVVISV